MTVKSYLALVFPGNYYIINGFYRIGIAFVFMIISSFSRFHLHSLCSTV